MTIVVEDNSCRTICWRVSIFRTLNLNLTHFRVNFKFCKCRSNWFEARYQSHSWFSLFLTKFWRISIDSKVKSYIILIVSSSLSVWYHQCQFHIEFLEHVLALCVIACLCGDAVFLFYLWVMTMCQLHGFVTPFFVWLAFSLWKFVQILYFCRCCTNFEFVHI